MATVACVGFVNVLTEYDTSSHLGMNNFCIIVYHYYTSVTLSKDMQTIVIRFFSLVFKCLICMEQFTDTDTHTHHAHTMTPEQRVKSSAENIS